MKYEYNGNLLFDDRIALVANEIMRVYPEIDKKLALKIAALEGPITTLNDDSIKFRRLYNIIYMNQFKKDIIDKVMIDMINIYKSLNNKNDKLNNFMMNMLNYGFHGGELPMYEC